MKPEDIKLNEEVNKQLSYGELINAMTNLPEEHYKIISSIVFHQRSANDSHKHLNDTLINEQNSQSTLSE